MRYWLEDYGPPILVIVSILLGFGALVHTFSVEQDRLMAQCLADGRKEYECAAIVRAAFHLDVPPQVIIYK